MSRQNSDTNGFIHYRNIVVCERVELAHLAKNMEHWRPSKNTVMNNVFHNKS
jgi:hypothetical protein